MFRIGSGYIDSGDLLTTTEENTEIIPIKTNCDDRYNCYKFSFLNKQNCHIVVNGTRCYREANQGWYSTEIDASIYSFIVEEIDVQYMFTGAY